MKMLTLQLVDKIIFKNEKKHFSRREMKRKYIKNKITILCVS